MATIRGGDKLAAALDEIARKLDRGATLEVGFMEGSTAPNGDSIPLRAALNEFGVPARGQPPRPFFRSFVAKGAPQWPALIGQALKNADYDAEKAMGIVGAVLVDELQQSIIDFTDPPLAPSTIKKKGFAKPLIEHSDMLRSVTARVRR